MQFVQFDKELEVATTRSQGRKRAIAVASGVMAIAAVTCVALLFVNAGHSSNEEMSMISSSDFALESTDLFDVADKVFSFKAKSIGLTNKKLQNILNTISTADQNIKKRTVILVLTYFFDVIDSDNDQLISEKEWTAFVAAVFPQDTAKYGPLFKEANGGKPVNFNQFATLLANKLNDGSIKNLTPTTPNEKIQSGFGKLILYDARSYELTYTLVFKIFDQDDNKVLTKAEVTQTLTALTDKAAQAAENANKLFEVAKQSKLSADGQNIKFEDYKAFALALQKNLQEKYKNSQALLYIEDLQAQLLIAKIEGSSQMLMKKAYENVLAQTENDDQEAIKQHLFNTITEFEFQLFNSNGDTVVSKAEHKAVIDAIYKNEEDRKHFYGEFTGINGGKDVTLAQFQAAILKKITSPDQIEKYTPKENPKVIGKRALKFILKNDRNYGLASDFVFNVFDLNADKVVELTEVQKTAGAFTQDAKEVAKLDDAAAKAFAALQNQGVGDGSKITAEEWAAFTKKIRSNLIEALKDPNGKGPKVPPPQPDAEPTVFFFSLY